MGNRIESHLCIGCGECQIVCPLGNIIVTDDALSEIDSPALCPLDCSSCRDVCPVDAVIIED